MQFHILALDATDADAPARRMQHREAHLAAIAEYKAKGHMKMGAALMDETGKMVGSTLIVEFETREAMDNWLKNDPYVIGKVWEKIEVRPCKVAPSFVG